MSHAVPVDSRNAVNLGISFMSYDLFYHQCRFFNFFFFLNGVVAGGLSVPLLPSAPHFPAGSISYEFPPV